MNRRRFLKRGLFGGALLTLGGAGYLALRSGHDTGDDTVRPTAPLHAIDEKVFPVLVALAGRMVHAEKHDPLALAHAVDFTIAFQSPEAVSDLNMALGLLENGLFGLFTRGSPTPFTKLSPDAQDRALAGWRDSRLVLLRGAFTALKRLCLGAHYASLSSAREIGYPGPFFEKPAAPPIVADQALSPPFVPAPLSAPAAPATTAGAPEETSP